MEIIWLFILAALAVVVAYAMGRRDGVLEANRSSCGPGQWVCVKKPLKCHVDQKGTITLPPGTQAIVSSGRDQWGRISLWVAEPWATDFRASLLGTVPKVHHVEDLQALRVIAPLYVSADIRESTIKRLREFGQEISDWA